MSRKGWIERVRAGIGFLSDVSGAALGVAAGIGLLVAAAVVIANLLPLAAEIMVSVAVFLIVTGMMLRWLGPKWQLPSPPPTPMLKSPYQAASELQSNYQQTQELKSARVVREELIDNDSILARVANGQGLRESFLRSWWLQESDTLLAMTNPRPYRTARAAYRRLDQLDQLYRTNGRLAVGDASAISEAREAVELAIDVLSQE